MKLFLIALALAAAGCHKERISRPLACGFVFDKYFASPPGDSSAANRTYYLWLASDTTTPIPPAPPISRWIVQVVKDVWDTMFVAGQPYPPRYCY